MAFVTLSERIEGLKRTKTNVLWRSHLLEMFRRSLEISSLDVGFSSIGHLIGMTTTVTELAFPGEADDELLRKRDVEELVVLAGMLGIVLDFQVRDDKRCHSRFRSDAADFIRRRIFENVVISESLLSLPIRRFAVNVMIRYGGDEYNNGARDWEEALADDEVQAILSKDEHALAIFSRINELHGFRNGDYRTEWITKSLKYGPLDEVIFPEMSRQALIDWFRDSFHWLPPTLQAVISERASVTT